MFGTALCFVFEYKFLLQLQKEIGVKLFHHHNKSLYLPLELILSNHLAGIKLVFFDAMILPRPSILVYLSFFEVKYGFFFVAKELVFLFCYEWQKYYY